MTVWVIMDFDEFVAVAATETAARERAESHADAALKSGHYGRDAERQFRWAGLQLERYGMAFGRSGWHQSGFWLIESELVGAETASAGFDSLPAGNGASPECGSELPPAAPASDPVPDENGDRADVALTDLDDALAHPCDCDAHNEIRRQMQDPAFVEAWAQLRERQSVVRTLDVAEETAALAKTGVVDGVG